MARMNVAAVFIVIAALVLPDVMVSCQSTQSSFLLQIADSLRPELELITRATPNWYSYTYDGTIGATPGFINDGGNDMYDGGNRVYFVDQNNNISLPLVYNQYYRQSDVEIITMTEHPFVALAWIENFDGIPNTYGFKVVGNAGADGSGTNEVFNSNFDLDPDAVVSMRSFQVHSANDPSICEVYFVISGERWLSDGVNASGINLQFNAGQTNILDNSFTLPGSPRRALMGYTLLSKSSGRRFTPEEVRLAVTYIFSPVYKELAPTCSNGLDNCDSNYAQCLNISNSLTCICENGFTGNGTVCTDIDECAINQNDCDIDAECINTNGSYRCVCNEGFVGNGTTCIPNFEVVCSSDSISVRVHRGFYTERDIRLDHLHLNDFSCGGIVDSDSSDVWIFRTETLSSCSTELLVNDTHFTYSNALMNTVANGEVTGHGVFTRFSCVYKRELEGLTFIFEHGVIGNTAIVTLPGGEGEFTATMNRFTDKTFEEPETRTEYGPTDTLHIKLQLGTDSNNFNLVLDRCWVTSTPDINHSELYAFIDDGCPVDGGNGIVNITRSGDGPAANFESRVFSFVEYDTTFLHCSLFICLSTENETCVPSCLLGRRKRSLTSSHRSPVERRKRQSTSEDNERLTEIVSLGPFVVVRENTDDDQQGDEEKSLSLTILVAILVPAVIVVLGSLVFALFWFRCRHGHARESKQLGVVGFTNAAMTKK